MTSHNQSPGHSILLVALLQCSVSKHATNLGFAVMTVMTTVFDCHASVRTAVVSAPFDLPSEVLHGQYH
eukprot:1600667-Amphidinium_carterae.1